jgi:hypothetical protein
MNEVVMFPACILRRGKFDERLTDPLTSGRGTMWVTKKHDFALFFMVAVLIGTFDCMVMGFVGTLSAGCKVDRNLFPAGRRGINAPLKPLLSFGARQRPTYLLSSKLSNQGESDSLSALDIATYHLKNVFRQFILEYEDDQDLLAETFAILTVKTTTQAYLYLLPN